MPPWGHQHRDKLLTQACSSNMYVACLAVAEKTSGGVAWPVALGSTTGPLFE